MVNKMLLILAALFLNTAVNAAGNELKLLPQDETAENRALLETFVTDTLALIPSPVLPASLPVISFRDYGNSQIEAPDCASESLPDQSHDELAQEYGKEIHVGFLYNVIQINRAFIPIIQKGQASALKYKCGHTNLYRLAQATLIHEVAHHIDREKLLSKQSSFRYLTKFYEKKSAANYLIAGGIAPGRQKSKNIDFERSPDPYEFTSPAEAFAVNFEYFILDREFGCRRPDLFQFFSDQLGYAPILKCSVNTKLNLSADEFLHQSAATEYNLDPARIYQIHYLFAGKGEGFSSRWGHAMYRLVICAPSRVEVNEECLKDIEHHLVVSFRADVNDVAINNLKGLIGRYASRSFLIPFYQVVKEYTKGELRDLYSVPLQLSAHDQKQFVYSVLWNYWAYRGKYKFFSNNCATESLGLVKGVTSDPRIQKVSALTPKGLFQDFNSAGLIDTSLFQDRINAEKQGLLYRSQKETLIKSYSVVIAASKMYKNLDDFIKRSDSKSRIAFYQQTETLKHSVREAANFLTLELHFKHHQELVLQKKLSLILEDPKHHEALESLKSYLAEQEKLSKTRVPSGYGIPLETDFRLLPAVVTPKSQMEEYSPEIQSALAAEIDEYNRIKQNIAFYRNKILQP